MLGLLLCSSRSGIGGSVFWTSTAHDWVTGCGLLSIESSFSGLASASKTSSFPLFSALSAVGVSGGLYLGESPGELGSTSDSRPGGDPGVVIWMGGSRYFSGVLGSEGASGSDLGSSSTSPPGTAHGWPPGRGVWGF